MHKKKSISLVAINPDALQNTSIALLEAYALRDSHLSEKADIKRFYFDALVPPQSNAVDLYIRQLLDFDGDIIGFSSYCWNIEIIIKMITEIKRIHSSATIFLGGPEATGSSFELLSKHQEIDYIISGEGEVAFYEFLMFSVGMMDIDDVSNLVYIKDEKLKTNKKQSLVKLDDIPRLFSSGFLDPNQIGHSLYSFETKRGCEYMCAYCLHHKGSHTIRNFSLDFVFAELNVLLKSNLKYIWIIDPCFNQQEERSIKILEYIEKHNDKNIEFGFEIRNETMTSKFIHTICRMPWIRFIAVGLQTLTAAALNSINRELNLEKFRNNLSLIRKISPKLMVHVDLIFGLPNDTLSGYKKSIDYVLDQDCDVFTQPLKMLPGSELTRDSQKHGIVASLSPPYEILYNDTFSYRDMCSAKCINAVLNLFQSNKQIKEAFKTLKAKTNRSYSDLFYDIGQWLWNKNKMILFTNYRYISLQSIADVLTEAIYDLYHYQKIVKFEADQMIKIDWGSIAPHS